MYFYFALYNDRATSAKKKEKSNRKPGNKREEWLKEKEDIRSVLSSYQRNQLVEYEKALFMSIKNYVS